MRNRGAVSLVCLLVVGTIACGSSEPGWKTYPLCFVAGTPVATPRGDVPIDRLEVGDLVWSWDVARGERVAAPVTAVTRGEASELYAIDVGGVRIAGVTGAHPFYDASLGRWVPAARLASGDQLLRLDDGATRAARVSLDAIVRRDLGAPTPVFNLEVAGHHNYFAHGVLVHNKQPAWRDADDDGHGEYDGDCDDSDPATYPGAPEVCGDDRDQNCAGGTSDGCATPALPGLGTTAGRDRTALLALAPPYHLALGEGRLDHWSGVIDLGVAGAITRVGWTAPEGWQMLPADAAVPAVTAVIQPPTPADGGDADARRRLVMIELVAPDTAHLVLDTRLPLVPGCDSLVEITVAELTADGARAKALTLRETADCARPEDVRTFRWDGWRYTSVDGPAPHAPAPP